MNICTRARSFNIAPRKNESAKRAEIIRNTAVALLTGTANERTAKRQFAKEMAAFSYPTEATKQVVTDSGWGIIQRFGEAAKQEPGEKKIVPPITVKTQDGQEHRVEFSYVTVNKENNTLTGTFLRVGKRAYDNRPAAEVREYLGLMALKQMVTPGKKAFLTSRNVYMRRSDDEILPNGSDSLKSADEFWARGGANVFAKSTAHEGGTDGYHDKAMESLIRKLSEGLEPEECTKADCEGCHLFPLCNYSEPPMKVEGQEKSRTVAAMCLTPSQEEAIEYNSGVARINAGAGVGKTLVVAMRTVTLLLTGAEPEDILLITFTESGANEMKERVIAYNDDAFTGKDASKIRVCTFNAFGNEIIKKEYARLGFSEPPVVVDEVERRAIIAQLLKDNPIRGLNYRNFYGENFTLGAVDVAAAVFSVIKGKGYTVMDTDKIAYELGYIANTVPHAALKALAELYDKYDAQMRESNLIEFADQEMLLFELLQDDPYYLEQFGFKHIIVDEFQDTNLQQMAILKYLKACPTCQSMMVVGDDSQGATRS